MPWLALVLTGIPVGLTLLIQMENFPVALRLQSHQLFKTTEEKQTYTIYFKNPFLLRANHPLGNHPRKFFHAFLLLKNQNASYLYRIPNMPHLPCHLILDAQGTQAHDATVTLFLTC